MYKIIQRLNKGLKLGVKVIKKKNVLNYPFFSFFRGFLCSVGRSSDFGSEGLGFDIRRLCYEFYPWGR